MPSGKNRKGKKTNDAVTNQRAETIRAENEPEVDEQQQKPQEDSDTENVDDLLPKPQAEWFAMVIKNQVKRHIPEYLRRQQAELEEMVDKKFEFLKQENNKLKEELELAKSEIDKLKWAKDGINRTLSKRNNEIEHLKQIIDNVDQKQRETRVRISGIAEEEGEDLEKKILKLAKNSLGLKKLKSSDIQVSHRSGKRKQMKTRDVIVQFTDKPTKDNFQQNKKKLLNKNDEQKRIYINDDLTEYRLKLLYDARQLVKRRKLKAAWSQYGNIMVLKTDNTLKAVFNYEDLRRASGMYGFEEDGSVTPDESVLDVDRLSSQSMISSDY